MNVLIIDRDSAFSQQLASRIQAAGHKVFETTIKNEAVENIGTNRIDVVYFDPSPMTDPKAILLQIRRMVNTYPYMIMMGQDIDRADGIRMGCNDGLSKPVDPALLQDSLENAERMTRLVLRIGDEAYDFPSSGGVISKSAFNQLFRSSIDRVARYNELAHVLFISIRNYDDIKLDDGKYAADYTVSKLAQCLVRLRRQSDILAQTGPHEYALLLQRPQTETESMDAAKRFSLALDEQHDITSNGVTDLLIDVSLIHLPTGSLDFQRTSQITAQGARNSA